MKQEGIVLKTEKGRALVKIFRSGACGENCKGCGMCSGECEKWVLNSAKANEGNKVLIYLESKYMLLMCIIAYLLPVLVLIIGFAVLENFIKNTALSDLISLCLMVLVIPMFAFIKFKSEKFSSRIVEIKGNDEQN